MRAQRERAEAEGTDEGQLRNAVKRERKERAEGEGSFFGASKACEKKNRRPVKRERPRQPGEYFFMSLFVYISFISIT